MPHMTAMTAANDITYSPAQGAPLTSLLSVAAQKRHDGRQQQRAHDEGVEQHGEDEHGGKLVEGDGGRQQQPGEGDGHDDPGGGDDVARRDEACGDGVGIGGARRPFLVDAREEENVVVEAEADHACKRDDGREPRDAERRAAEAAKMRPLEHAVL
eukprot:10667-Pleurochrysis_carterae.AAC.1